MPFYDTSTSVYGIPIWENSCNKHLKRLQNKAVKIIAGAHWLDHATPYYAQLGVLKLKEL